MRPLLALGFVVSCGSLLGCDPTGGPAVGGSSTSGAAPTSDDDGSATASSDGDTNPETTDTGPGSSSDSNSTSVTTSDPSTSTTSGLDDSGATTSGSSDTTSGHESSGTSGDPDPRTSECDDTACFTECSQIVPGTEDADFGPCYNSFGEWTRDCDYPQPCPMMDTGAAFLDADTFVPIAQCFISALSTSAPARLDYTVEVGAADMTQGVIFVRGDGTAMLELIERHHCDDGGVMGMRPFKTGVRTIDFTSDLGGSGVTCSESSDALALYDCLFEDGSGHHDALPWLEDQCLDVEPSCELGD